MNAWLTVSSLPVRGNVAVSHLPECLCHLTSGFLITSNVLLPLLQRKKHFEAQLLANREDLGFICLYLLVSLCFS